MAKKKKGDKEDTLTKILLLIIFIMLVFYVPDLLKTINIKEISWKSKAEANLEASIQGIQGEEYLFVQGDIISTCTKIESDNHCPLKVLKIKPSSYLNDRLPSFYTTTTPENLKIINGTSEDIVLEPKDVRFVSFLKKNDRDMKVYIKDYILDTSICRNSILNDTMCSISWTKKFRIDSVTKKRTDVSIELNKFDIKKTDNATEIEIQGKIRGTLISPEIELREYNYGKTINSLNKRETLNLVKEKGYYSFHTIMSLPRAIARVGYMDVDEKDEFVETNKEKKDVMFLFLFQDQDYFYAKEKLVQGDRITEKTYK